MRSGAQPNGSTAGSRYRAHTVLFASVLVAGTLVTLSQRGAALSRYSRLGAGHLAKLTPQQVNALAANGLLDPHGVAPVRFPKAAATRGNSGSDSGTGSSKSTMPGAVDSTAAAGALAAAAKQQTAAGRQPTSFDATAGRDTESDAAADTAATEADLAAFGGSNATEESGTVQDTEAAAALDTAAGNATIDEAVNATGGVDAASNSAQAVAEAGSSKQCQCPTMETDGNAAAAQAYGRDYFAICLSVKDQQADIREWVAHHAAVGAGRLYIYDTGSIPPLNEILQDHIASGQVEYIWWEPDFGTGKGAGRKFPQEDIYDHCLENFRSRHQFIGMIDSDEFLIPKNSPGSVPAILQRMMAFEPFGALAVNWVVFGSSGHKERPTQGVLQAYTKCQRQQRNAHASHIKSIVNTQVVIEKQGPHHFNYTDGMYAVNEHFQRVDGPMYEPATVDKIALHHYVLKSEQEFREKMKRGSAMGNHKPFEFFTAIDETANLTCTAAVEWGPYQ